MDKTAKEKGRLIDRIGEQEAQLRRVLLADSGDNPFFSMHLTIQQLRVLLTLSFSGSIRGRASGSELSEALGVGLATVTGIVDRLAAQGLVERRDDPSDRRVRYVFLTEEGEHVTEGVIDAGMDRRKRFMRSLDVEELRSLETLTAKILDAAVEEAESEGVRPKAVLRSDRRTA